MRLERPILTCEKVVEIFETEFASIRNKFSIHDLGLSEARDNSERSINGPGVYVYWRHDLGVIKVGKSQSNSKSRAFEHLRDNTRTQALEMSTLNNDSRVRLMLFNVLRHEDAHWVPSVEAFMDKAAHPLIPSGRIG